ncbi:ATP-binding protein [Streptomyces sp. NPDC051018]|uniref:ATP-binding protein n=1 Tax=Streptomyces sp. NPDC051018 TaxID=3365639 RepID=UPI0037A0DAE6
MYFTAPQSALTVRVFSRRLPTTRRGARLARQLTVGELRRWGIPAAVTDRAEVVVAELAANAALHARVRDRGFRLTLTYDTAFGALRLEVTDARGDLPLVPPEEAPGEELPEDGGESGRGLLLVGALADRWGSTPCPPSSKTVWAELDSGAD